MVKLGKICHESRPQGSQPAGLMPAAFWSKSRSGLSQGPNRPLRRMRSIGLSMLSGRVQGCTPAVLTRRCGPEIDVRRRLEPRFLHRIRQVGRRLLRVQHGRVVELLEGVHIELPVRSDLGAVEPALGLLVERVVLQLRHVGAEEVDQVLLGLLRQIHEDEAGPHVAVHRHQAVVTPVEVEELLLLLHEGAGAVEVVTPTVVLADELA